MKPQVSITSISPAMKMADLLDVNFSILGVFSRFGMSYGFGEATVKEVCDGMGIDPETFLIICKVYAFDGYRPSREQMEGACLEDIVRYLRLSHTYYLETMVPALAAAIAYQWIVDDTYDHFYVENRTEGFEEFKAYILGKEDGIVTVGVVPFLLDPGILLGA